MSCVCILESHWQHKGHTIDTPSVMETPRNITLAQTLPAVSFRLHEMLEKAKLQINRKQGMGFHKDQEFGRREYKWDERNSFALNLGYSHTSTNCHQILSSWMPKPANVTVYKLFLIKLC